MQFGRSPLEGVAEALQGGMRIGLAKEAEKRYAEEAALQRQMAMAQLEIRQAEERRAVERHKSEMERARDAMEERHRARQREKLDRRIDLEKTKLQFGDFAAQRRERDEIDLASEAAGIASLDDLAASNPELAPQIEDARKTLGELKSPAARALYAADRGKALQGFVQQREAQQAKSFLRQALRRNYLGSEDGQPDEGGGALVQSIMAALDTGEMNGRQAIDALEQYRRERVEDETDMETRSMGKRMLKEQYAHLFAADPDGAKAALAAINGYGRGLGTLAETRSEVNRILARQAAEKDGASEDITPLQRERLLQGMLRKGSTPEEIQSASDALDTRLGVSKPKQVNGTAPDAQASDEQRTREIRDRIRAAGGTFKDYEAALKAAGIPLFDRVVDMKR